MKVTSKTTKQKKVTMKQIEGLPEILTKSPALYPYIKSDVRTFNIQPGSYAWDMDDIFQGQMPKRVIVGLVSGESYSESVKKNPYNFQHFNCNFMGYTRMDRAFLGILSNVTIKQTICWGISQSICGHRHVSNQ